MFYSHRRFSPVLAVLIVFVLASCAGGPKKESTGEYIDSAAISTKVRTAIVGDEQLSIFNIDVKTYKDRVQLSGFVNTPEQRQRAGEVASNVEGVKAVENNIVVK